MNHQNKHDFLNESVSTLSGVGTKIKNMLKKKRLKKYLIYCGVFHIVLQIVLIYKH